MKKFYTLGLTVCLSLLGLSVSAQDSPLTWGIKAGVNLSNASIKDHSGDMKARVGFQVGVTLDYAITNDFYFQSGLSFTTKGAKNEYEFIPQDTGHKEKSTKKINQMYLQLPIMAAYKLEVAPDTKIVFNAGPYFAYGIGGKIKTDIVETDSEGNLGKNKFDTFSDNRLKRFDFGLGAGVGAEFGQIVVGLNYELGLANIADWQGGSYKNRNASLTLGYKF